MNKMLISVVWSVALGDVTHFFMQLVKVAVPMLHSPTVISNIHLYDVNLKNIFFCLKTKYLSIVFHNKYGFVH